MALATAAPRVGRHAYARSLHPMAWWLWGVGLATAASRTTNVVLLGLLVAAAAVVVAERRSTAPWARSFGMMLRLGAFVVVLRVALQAVLGADVPGHVLVTLPEPSLPGVLNGLSLGGPVTVEGLVAAAREGLRLAAMIACLGAAMSLASPHRVLASLPAALYEAGVAVVVAVSFVPQAIGAVGRARDAQRLRGRSPNGLRGLRHTAVAVLEGGLGRAVDLAASMDSRGYGRTARRSPAARRASAALVLGGLLGAAAGSYVLLGDEVGPATAAALLGGGCAAATAGFVLAGRRSVRTRYRPDPWRVPEWAVAACGAAVAAAYVVGAALRPLTFQPPAVPLTLPEVWGPALLCALLAVAPAVLAPPPPVPGGAR